MTGITDPTLYTHQARNNPFLFFCMIVYKIYIISNIYIFLYILYIYSIIYMFYILLYIIIHIQYFITYIYIFIFHISYICANIDIYFNVHINSIGSFCATLYWWWLVLLLLLLLPMTTLAIPMWGHHQTTCVLHIQAQNYIIDLNCFMSIIKKSVYIYIYIYISYTFYIIYIYIYIYIYDIIFY